MNLAPYRLWSIKEITKVPHRGPVDFPPKEPEILKAFLGYDVILGETDVLYGAFYVHYRCIFDHFTYSN